MPSTSMWVRAGSTCWPSVATWPSTRTRPLLMRASLARREATPAAARIFWRRSSGIVGVPGRVRARVRTAAAHFPIVAEVSRGACALVRVLEPRCDVGVERRQVLEGRQAEALQEVEARAVEDRAARRIRATQLRHEAPMEEAADRVVRIDAPDPLDDGLRDRLAIGDDGQGLEGGRREADGVAADEAGEQRAALGGRGQLHPIGREEQPDATIPEGHLEVAETCVDRVAIDTGNDRDLAAGERPLRDEEEGLQSGLGQLAGRRGLATRRGLAGRARRRLPGASRAVDRRGADPGVSSIRLPDRGFSHGRLVDHRKPAIDSSSGISSASRPSPAAARSAGVVRRATIGPNGVAWSTTISRRFMSSRRARNVTVTTIRSRTPARSSWRTIEGADRRAVLM